MADLNEVKQYLACWFQLKKKVLLRNGQEELLPQKIIEGNVYSPEFESCWQRILDPQSGDCYLEGTTQTIHQLLSPIWNLSPCVRCKMPVPNMDLGCQHSLCPCQDLADWPNLELPIPRPPLDSLAHLQGIQQRLKDGKQLSTNKEQ